VVPAVGVPAGGAALHLAGGPAELPHLLHGLVDVRDLKVGPEPLHAAAVEPAGRVRPLDVVAPWDVPGCEPPAEQPPEEGPGALGVRDPDREVDQLTSHASSSLPSRAPGIGPRLPC